MLQDNIINKHQNNIAEAKVEDDERREEKINDLDIRLKSLIPRKGKMEVEEYDKRLTEIEKYELKLKKHKENIIQKNEKDKEDNKKIK